MLDCHVAKCVALALIHARRRREAVIESRRRHLFLARQMALIALHQARYARSMKRRRCAKRRLGMLYLLLSLLDRLAPNATGIGASDGGSRGVHERRALHCASSVEWLVRQGLRRRLGRHTALFEQADLDCADWAVSCVGSSGESPHHLCLEFCHGARHRAPGGLALRLDTLPLGHDGASVSHLGRWGSQRRASELTGDDLRMWGCEDVRSWGAEDPARASHTWCAVRTFWRRSLCASWMRSAAPIERLSSTLVCIDASAAACMSRCLLASRNAAYAACRTRCRPWIMTAASSASMCCSREAHGIQGVKAGCSRGVKAGGSLGVKAGSSRGVKVQSVWR